MAINGLFDVTVNLENIDQSRARAVAQALRAAWIPIHTGWTTFRGDPEGLYAMSADGFILDDDSFEAFAARLRDAVVKANGRACTVSIEVDQLVTFPGRSFAFGPRGGRKSYSTAPPRK